MKKEIKSSLVVFAREPRLGKVKTRLQKYIPQELVLRIYKAFLSDLLNMLLQVPCHQRYIFYAGHLREKAFLRKYSNNYILKMQKGMDLGQRMYNAFSYVQKKDNNKTIIIGTDCLDINPKDLTNAFKALDRRDGVLGPTFDGGYYLIGLMKANKSLFNGIPWSTDSVFQRTVKKAKKANLKISALDCKEDVDEMDALIRLSHSINKIHYPKTHQCLTSKKMKSLFANWSI